MTMRHSRILFATFACVALTGAAEARTIQFSGYEWTVRADGAGPPRNNNWCDANIFVDAQGRLHMKLTRRPDGSWCAAELKTVKRLGFGTYQWQLASRVDQLDPNVVFGLFHYPTTDVGPDATNELDIEFTRWGNPTANILNYTVWPTVAGIKETTTTYPMMLNGDWSTHRYTWTPQSVHFQSTHGHYDHNPLPIADWTYKPEKATERIAQKPMPLYMNLWLTAPPTNAEPVEIIITKFTFTPA